MVVGITGLCCSGKNLIAEFFRTNGFTIIDVDDISHSVFNDFSNEIVNIFGKDIVENGVINRKKIGEIVFSNKHKLLTLEELLHPEIYQRIFNILNRENRDIAINIPLLTNRELVQRLDSIIWVKSMFWVRIYRTIKRDSYGLITIIKRIASQKKLNVKQFNSDVDIYFINNSFTKKHSRKQVQKFLEKYRG